LFPNRYLHCDFDGRAFARSCAPHLKWRQELLSCMPDNVSIESINNMIANRTNKLNRIRPAVSNQVNSIVTPIKIAAETVQPIMINQGGIPKLAPFNGPVNSQDKTINRVLQPVNQEEYSGYERNQRPISKAARLNNQLRDEIRQSEDVELDQAEDQQKQQEQIQKQQEQIQQQQQQIAQQQLLQQQQLEQQQQRDKQQQEQDKKTA